ncbi:MAG: BatD family protein [Gammaproteobacteria bacterium]
MVNYKKLLLGILLLSVLNSMPLMAAEITATVDRNPIPVGESFQFVLDARGSIDEDPDFSELQKIFRIINTRQSSNFRLINGSITRNKTWTMTLMLEEAGDYEIPAINFGKDKSDPIAIKIVSNTVTQKNKQQAEIYLEIDVEPKTVYVQQQLIYTIKLFRRIQLNNASLSEPVSENNQSTVTKLGEDSAKRIAINGVAYTVLERRYAIFPQKSGLLKIKPITFETQIVRNSRQRSFFNMDPFTAGVKRLKSKAIEIQVKGIPHEFNKKYPSATWLPVDNLTITEKWSGDKSTLTSGEPITRTISLIAQNLSTAQLPDIKIEAPKNIKIYPDIPVITERNNKKGLVAIKEFKTALLATKMGKQTLSEIVIPWWNTKTNTIQESRLDSQIINVGAAVSQVEENKLKLDDSVSSSTANNAAAVDSDTKLQPQIQKQADYFESFMWIIISAIFVFLWLITVFLWFRLRSKYRAIIAGDAIKKFSGTEINASYNRADAVSIKDIKKACLKNDAGLCNQLLIQWANSNCQSEQFTNLSSLLAFADPALQNAIIELQRYLYGNKANAWSGAALWAAFNSNPPVFASGSTKRHSAPTLPSLYANYK